MELDKSKTFVYRIDKAEECTAFHATDELMRRILEAENEAFKVKVKANTVVVNGRKYGVLKDTPGFVNTLFGMKLETPVDMPDNCDFFLQERPPVLKTNGDSIRSMTDEELADTFNGGCPNGDRLNCRKYYKNGGRDCFNCWLDWLKSPVEEET